MNFTINTLEGFLILCGVVILLVSGVLLWVQLSIF